MMRKNGTEYASSSSSSTTTKTTTNNATATGETTPLLNLTETKYSKIFSKNDNNHHHSNQDFFHKKKENPNVDIESPTPPAPAPAPAPPTNNNHDKDVTPTWTEMMQKVAPFLNPEDIKHKVCLVLALTLIVISKLVNVLPPLAIKRAVDIMTNYSSVVVQQQQQQQQQQLQSNEESSEIKSENDIINQSIQNAILAYVGLQILSVSLSSIQAIAQRTVNLDAERRFGISVFAHLQHLSLSYHLEKHIGEITQIMSRGSDSVSTLLNAILFSLFPTLFETMVVTAIFSKLGIPIIAITTFVTVILYVGFSYLVTKTRIRYRREVNEASDALSLQETETLVNYETVCMFGRTKSEIQTYGKLRQRYKQVRETIMYVFQSMQFVLRCIRLLGTAAGLLVAGWQTVYANPPLSPGSFVVVQIYIDQLFQPLSALAVTYRNLIQAFTDLEKVVTMLNRVPEVQDLPNAYEWKPTLKLKEKEEEEEEPSGEIVFENVSFYYKMNSRKRALGSALVDLNTRNQKRGGRGGRWGGGGGGPGGRHRRGGYGGGPHQFWDLAPPKTNSKPKEETKDPNETNMSKVKNGITKTSFRIPPGKTAALVGRSGSGKTTIIRLVLRMYDPDEGSVSIDGHNVKEITQKSLRDNIGVVAQDTVLFNATLRENIIYGKPDATEEEIWKAVESAALLEFVNGLPDKLETIVGERGMKLSGGERQRVGLARCVIKNPKLILLDEATSALDSGTEKVIQKNIAEICKSRTTLMIAHRLSTARFADEIIVLEKGEICERGTHSELISREGGRYAKMWADQSQPNSTLNRDHQPTLRKR